MIGLEDKVRDLYRTIGDLQRMHFIQLHSLVLTSAPEDLLNDTQRPLLTRSDAERHVGDRSAAGARRADMR